MVEGMRGNSNRLYIAGDSLSSCGKPDNKPHNDLEAQTSAKTKQPSWRASMQGRLSKWELPTCKRQAGCFGENLKTFKGSKYSLE